MTARRAAAFIIGTGYTQLNPKPPLTPTALALQALEGALADAQVVHFPLFLPGAPTERNWEEKAIKTKSSHIYELKTAPGCVGQSNLAEPLAGTSASLILSFLPAGGKRGKTGCSLLHLQLCTSCFQELRKEVTLFTPRHCMTFSQFCQVTQSWFIELCGKSLICG
jgi:hypothetical protein